MVEAEPASQASCISSIYQTMDYNDRNILVTDVTLRLYQSKPHSLKYLLLPLALQPAVGFGLSNNPSV